MTTEPNLSSEPDTSEHREPDALSFEGELLHEESLCHRLTIQLLDNLVVWLQRLGNPAWVRGRVTGKESGEVTCGAAFVHQEEDGRMHISFFEMSRTGDHRVGDAHVLNLDADDMIEAQMISTVELAKAVALTDPLLAKPMDPYEFSQIGRRTKPPRPRTGPPRRFRLEKRIEKHSD